MDELLRLRFTGFLPILLYLSGTAGDPLIGRKTTRDG